MEIRINLKLKTFCQVGYGEADLGITNIWYLPDRQSLVDYSHYVGDTAMKWVSKPPGKLPPFTNIIRVFDNQCWAWIGASVMFVILACWIVCRLGPSYGVVNPLDKVLIVLLPLATLTVENMPRPFKSKSRDSKEACKKIFPNEILVYVVEYWGHR